MASSTVKTLLPRQWTSFFFLASWKFNPLGDDDGLGEVAGAEGGGLPGRTGRACPGQAVLVKSQLRNGQNGSVMVKFKIALLLLSSS